MENQIKAILHCRSLVWQIQFIRSELMRKFAKISAVLAAMVLALAFAGCNSSSDDDGSSSTKNILAGKTYYSIDFEKVEYTSELINKAKIQVSMCAFDSNGQKVKWTELKYDFNNGTVERNEIIGPDEFNYSVSGSTLTVGGDNDPFIAAINSDGTIKDEEGSVMKEFKGNLYAFAKAEPDSKELLSTAYIIIVDGTTACNLEMHTYSSKNGLDDPFVLEGTVSGSTLKFTDERKDGQTVTVFGTVSDKEIKMNDSPDGPITLKRM